MMRGWGDNERSYEAVRDIFKRTFKVDNEPISKSTVQRTVERVNVSDSVKNIPSSGLPAANIIADKRLNIKLSITEECHNC